MQDFVAHKVLKTRSDLIQMGFDRDVVDNLPTQNTVTMNDERLARFADIDESSINDAPDESTEDIEIYECYVKMRHGRRWYCRTKKSYCSW